MMLCGLIGDPVAHSLSPVMHTAAFAALGLDASYESWLTPAAGLASRVASLRRDDVLGANVTVPHKQAVMNLCDDVSLAASRIGAVNTLVQRDGRLHGDNTDAYGFVRALRELPNMSDVRSALILGAGGAARAVAVALGTDGVDSLRIANRTHARASALVSALSDTGLTGIETVYWDDLSTVMADVELVVNATSMGWHGDDIPISVELLDLLRSGASVFDLTYRDTALIQAARVRGIAVTDGLGMLIHQGARSLELWTGRPAPIEVMREAVMTEQLRRG
ncbi:MAG: shikimate dehydrogenase [Chloroflexota bacterium]|nr:shikimate dehydrogenase [Chloroflexota bacterium]